MVTQLMYTSKSKITCPAAKIPSILHWLVRFVPEPEAACKSNHQPSTRKLWAKKPDSRTLHDSFPIFHIFLCWVLGPFESILNYPYLDDYIRLHYIVFTVFYSMHEDITTNPYMAASSRDQTCKADGKNVESATGMVWGSEWTVDLQMANFLKPSSELLWRFMNHESLMNH